MFGWLFKWEYIEDCDNALYYIPSYKKAQFEHLNRKMAENRFSDWHVGPFEHAFWGYRISW